MLYCDRKHMSVLDSMKDDEVDKGSTTQRSETGTPSAAKKTPTQVEHKTFRTKFTLLESLCCTELKFR